MRLVELASGVDSLYLSGRGTLCAPFSEQLARGREEARDRGEPIPLAVGQEEFGLYPYGWLKYAYRLEHSNALFGLTASKALPVVRAQPRAAFLHGVGVEGAIDWMVEALSPVVDNLRFKVSRLDLFADVQGWHPNAASRDRFVTRARAVDMYEREDRFTGFTFGRRGGGALVGRIYDKTIDVKNKGTDYWQDIWGERRRSEEPVFRVEFEFGREILRQFSVDTPESALAGRGDLWSYGSEWLSYRTPTADQTRSRWPVAPEWEFIRRASLRGHSIGLERVRKASRSGSIRRQLPGLSGYAASVAAFYGADSIEAAMPHIEHGLHIYEDLTGTPFSARVRHKMGRNRWT